MKNLKNDIRARQVALGACLVLVAPFALAADIPNAGDTLRNIERKAPTTPPKPAEIHIEREEHPIAPYPAAVAKIKFPVQEVRIIGNTVFHRNELTALVKKYAKPDQTLAGLEAAAANITDFYRKRGYFVARAYLPAQEIKNGVVEIIVLEGRYGEITLNNNSRTQDAVLNNHVAQSQLGDIIDVRRLEHALLLIGDVSQVDEVLAVLRPGKEVGTSDLVIQVGTMPPPPAVPPPSVTEPGVPPPEATPPTVKPSIKSTSLMQGSVSVDNYGTRVTGRYRVGASARLNSPSGYGDRLEGRILTSGQGQDYARLAYGIPVGPSGLQLGLAYTNSSYQIGEEFSALDADGRAVVWTASATYPLIRSRGGNLYTDLSYDQKSLNDHVGATNSNSEKRNNILGLGLSGNRNEASGSSTTFTLRIESGRLLIETPSAKAIDELTARTDGSYTKLGYSLARYQRLTTNTLLYLALSGQRASKNLDSVEKMPLGGPYGVRAYPVGEAAGDDGFLATAEIRYEVAQTMLPGKLNLIGFYDTGKSSINHNPYASGDNVRTLSGAGFGISLAKPRNYESQLSYASRVGNTLPANAADRSSQYWLQISKTF